MQCHAIDTAKSLSEQLRLHLANKRGIELEGIPQGSQGHSSNILAVQVCSAGVVAGSPHLLVLQYWDRIVTNDSLHMGPTLDLTDQNTGLAPHALGVQSMCSVQTEVYATGLLTKARLSCSITPSTNRDTCCIYNIKKAATMYRYASRC